MIAPTRTDVVEWIAGDWDELTADTIANGFKGVVKESIDDGASKRQVGQIVGRIESMDLLDKRMGEVSDLYGLYISSVYAHTHMRTAGSDNV
ncbi:hypothetical protein PC115_g3302 [Phytophthora cactorum]|uniref:Uncharacterized protein n=1 Tax=Phytophthora cactorum TaxID=29920 RepID=A0A8T1DC72_9STRA|nr:hypothetical protein PC115_g3302 [Phytophthora cactorum]